MDQLGPTLEDLYTEIGRTLLIWGWLEGEMTDAKIAWRHTAPEQAEGALKTFLAELSELRAIRNAIAHGLSSSHSDPYTPGFEPYVICRTFESEPRTITLGDLRRTQVKLQRLRTFLPQVVVS